jgi:predicted component of type VI protein secretion system
MEILVSIRNKADSSAREVKVEVGDGLVIGRGAEQGVLLDGPDLSREHLVITTDGVDLYVADLSSNGTWLNGNRLKRSAKTRVTDEDLVEIPDYALTFQRADAAAKKKEAAIEPAPAPVLAMPSVPSSLPALPEKSSGLFSPVFGFIGSFTFLEKFAVVMAAGGLALLFSYFGS